MAAQYRGLGPHEIDWLRKRPALAAKLLREERAVLRAAPPGTDQRGATDEHDLPPRTRPLAAGRGRRSSARKGATLVEQKRASRPSERRHVERADHDRFIASTFEQLHIFYRSLVKNVARHALDTMLERIDAFYNYDEALYERSHPLRGTPLIAAAAMVGRGVRSIVHMRGERGPVPSTKVSRLMGTRVGIACGGQPTRTWTEASTRISSGVERKLGSTPETSARMTPRSMDLLAKRFLDLAYAKGRGGAYQAALAFTVRFVARSPNGVVSALDRAALGTPR